LQPLVQYVWSDRHVNIGEHQQLPEWVKYGFEVSGVTSSMEGTDITISAMVQLSRNLVITERESKVLS